MFIITKHGIRISSCLINCHRQLFPIHNHFLSLIGRLCIFLETHIDLTLTYMTLRTLAYLFLDSYLDLTQSRSLAILQSHSRMKPWANSLHHISYTSY